MGNIEQWVNSQKFRIETFFVRRAIRKDVRRIMRTPVSPDSELALEITDVLPIQINLAEHINDQLILERANINMDTDPQESMASVRRKIGWVVIADRLQLSKEKIKIRTLFGNIHTEVTTAKAA